MHRIAAAFAKLPQKVIWRYKGSRPDTLGNNTLLVDWMPQNDLLGHPKIKVFVAHGGTNGVQEALYHGVPVVGIPMFFDQYDNLLRLEDRGTAKILTLSTVDKDNNFLQALRLVLNEPSYRMNMQRLHKGAAHLKPASLRMSWYSYHSVDVALFLGGAVLLMFLTTFFLIRCLCNAMCKPKIKRE
uniref:UDP-glucuronosyltransferase n=1 Tax=Acanthochromis polyacanthus TaxID=80966 RepID=A0A3Q1ENP3_9TELE